MAVGIPLPTNYSDGDVWSASDVNDITGTINTLGGGNFAAGKNKIINGDFGVWQRGTSFTNPSDASYTTDRFMSFGNGTGATKTMSQQTFTPGTAPVAGYEGTYFWRVAQSVAGTGATYNLILQRIEDGRTLANQSVTFSAWIKADAARTLTFSFNRNYGSGGSSMDYSIATSSNLSVTTSWQRFTFSFTMPTVSGKTFGTGSYLEAVINFPNNTAQTIDIWGVQLEAGSTATAFQTATGTIQGELAACQRYYYVHASGGDVGSIIGMGAMTGSNIVEILVSFPTSMRIIPTAISATGSSFYRFDRNGGSDDFNSITGAYLSINGADCYNNTEISGTSGQAGSVRCINASSLLAFNAEL
jgi:hypothetical protein